MRKGTNVPYPALTSGNEGTLVAVLEPRGGTKYQNSLASCRSNCPIHEKCPRPGAPGAEIRPDCARCFASSALQSSEKTR
jgi:hypothetical protein